MKDAEQLLKEKGDIKITHTPGPWFQSHLQDKTDGMYYTRVYDHKEHIATLHWYPIDLGDGVTGTRREANAKLIAAAPELLATLEKVRTAIRNSNMKNTILHEEIRRVIKKATE